MMPADDTIAFLRIVLVRSEAAGSVLEFDPYALLAITGVSIRNAIGIGRSDFLDSELKPFSDP